MIDIWDQAESLLNDFEYDTMISNMKNNIVNINSDIFV